MARGVERDLLLRVTVSECTRDNTKGHERAGASAWQGVERTEDGGANRQRGPGGFEDARLRGQQHRGQGRVGLHLGAPTPGACSFCGASQGSPHSRILRGHQVKKKKSSGKSVYGDFTAQMY